MASSMQPGKDLRYQQIDNLELYNSAKECTELIEKVPPPLVSTPFRDWGRADPTIEQISKGEPGDQWVWRHPYSPEDPVMTQDQIILLHRWRRGGIVGLARQIREFVEQHIQDEDEKARRAFKKFLEDDDAHPGWLPLVISTIHPDFVEPIILGTLPSFIDKHLHLEQHLRPTNRPGGYLNYPCMVFSDSGAKITGPQPISHSGWFMTPIFLLDIYESMGAYLDFDSSDHTKLKYSEDVASRTDGAFPHGSYVYGQRRYCKNKNQAKEIERWLDQIWHICVREIKEIEGKDSTNPILSKSILHVLAEAGWGIDVNTRAPMQRSHQQPTVIFGLFTATMLALSQTQLGKEYDIRVYQPIHAPYAETADMTEIVLFFLGGCSVEEGGFNYKAPGSTASTVNHDLRNTKFFQANREHIFNSPAYRRGLDESRRKVSNTMKLKEEWDGLEELKKRVLKMEEKNREEAKLLLERSIKIDEAEKLKKEFDEAKKTIDDYERSIRRSRSISVEL